MTPFYTDDWLTLYGGDARAVLAELPADSVDCVVTSPPYWGLRDYGSEGQLGLERTPEEYVANMVAVFAEVRRVLKPSGTCWLNLGDSYASTTSGTGARGGSFASERSQWQGEATSRDIPPGLKPKDLVGIPWRVAFALQQPRYTGTIKDEKDRVWLAAMIDGEGCLFIHKRKVGQSNGQGYERKNDTYGSGMEISNTSEAIVQRCMEITGKGSIVRQEKERKQPLYRWNLRSNECREVVREVYDHLVGKKHQARLLIGCPSSGEKAAAAHQALMDLHNGIPTGVDFPAPASMWEPGWYLRSDVIWSKSNPMPESVTDRPTKSHEYLFLLTKSARYYFDADAVRESFADERMGNPGPHKSAYANDPVTGRGVRGQGGPSTKLQAEGWNADGTKLGRNLRSVWTIATRPYPGAHFAVFPPELPERCIKAGSSERGVCPECGAPWERIVERTGADNATNEVMDDYDVPGLAKNSSADRVRRLSGATYQRVVAGTNSWRPTCGHVVDDAGPAIILDPFAGSGTVGMVANRLSRRAILIDLNPEYLKQQMKRNAQTPLGLSA